MSIKKRLRDSGEGSGGGILGKNETTNLQQWHTVTVPLSQLTCANGWQENQRFLTDVLHEVMLLDGLSSSHPISQEVEQASDIDRVFDWIAYKKVRQPSPSHVFFARRIALVNRQANELDLCSVYLFVFYSFSKTTLCRRFQL